MTRHHDKRKYESGWTADSIYLAQVNSEIVQLQRVQTPAGEAQLRGLIETHVENTSSKKGQAILSDWAKALPKFWQLVPPSESGTPEALQEEIKEVAEKPKASAAAA